MKHHISCIDLKLLFLLVNDLEKINSFFFTLASGQKNLPLLKDFMLITRTVKRWATYQLKPQLKRHRKPMTRFYLLGNGIYQRMLKTWLRSWTVEDTRTVKRWAELWAIKCLMPQCGTNQNGAKRHRHFAP